jgi:hypothetical protein
MLNNFNTRLGLQIGRSFAALFPHDPQYEGRHVITFHNQRDFVFFRHHRYIFRDAKKVGLLELGPKFTLKLRSLQKGTFNSKFGEYEWIHKVIIIFQSLLIFILINFINIETRNGIKQKKIFNLKLFYLFQIKNILNSFQNN